jgi:hypothetical protein
MTPYADTGNDTLDGGPHQDVCLGQSRNDTLVDCEGQTATAVVESAEPASLQTRLARRLGRGP